MPELPDVETFRRYFDAHALNRVISGHDLEEPRLLDGIDEGRLAQALHGHAFDRTHRHGKYLFAHLDHGPWLVLHFGMTGEPRAYGADEAPPPYARFVIHFRDGGHLAYVDPRKLGEISLTPDPQTFVRDKGLGPDALGLDWPTFRHLAEGARGMVKAWLMDQHHLAGIGNIYGDEILFQAGIHPRRRMEDLDQDDLKRLHQAMQEALAQAIGAHADPATMPPHFLIPHRHKGGHCPRCGAPLSHTKIGGRTSWFCPRCQPLESG